MLSSAKRQIILVGYGLFVAIGWVGVLVPTLILSVEHFYHQSDASLGLFYAATALSGAIGSFSCGLATERFGRRIVTPAVSLLLGLGLIGQALAPGWLWFFTAAVVANVGAGALDGDINGLFLDIHADGRTGGALNLLHLFFSAGAAGGALLLGSLVNWGTPWQALIGCTGLVVIALAIVAAVLPLPSGKRKVQEPTGPELAINPTERSLIPFIGLTIAICVYVGAELGVTSWVVRYVAQSNVRIGALALSTFWGGITLGRLLSSRVVDNFNPAKFTIGCFLISSVALAGAVLSNLHPLLALLLYGLTGCFYGPIFPMIMVIGGKIYPHRLAVLSGSLSAAAAVGAIVYPGLMGFISVHYGLAIGMIGAALLGLFGAASLFGVAVFRRVR
jgi:fucose permease